MHCYLNKTNVPEILKHATTISEAAIARWELRGQHRLSLERQQLGLETEIDFSMLEFCFRASWYLHYMSRRITSLHWKVLLRARLMGNDSHE